MKLKTLIGFGAVLIILVLGTTNLQAAKTPDPEVIPLTETGKKLEARYAAQLARLQAEIAGALPAVNAQKKAEFLAVYQAESAAMSVELKALRGQDRKPEDHPSKKVYAEAKEALAQAVSQAKPVVTATMSQLQPFLATDVLDTKLATCALLMHATPRGLAEFAQQGSEQQALIDLLLADKDLIKQMMIADGAEDGKYGHAMEIYTAIQKATQKAGSGVLQRLALGVSLEHAVPRGQRSAKADMDAPATVDPVKRYLSYEKAFLDGELDPGFKDLSVWDYRMVVNGEEPDEIAAWGRNMLHNYRPDHISTSDYRWRYVKAVKTDVRYGSQYNKFDKPEQQFFQNILMNGGICGRRAFFGRFILRAFGIPTTARPQRGHAALAHWTPDGWVVCLGAGWPWGWTKTKYKEGLDFLANTQARMAGAPFIQVVRARWAGTAVGESESPGFHGEASGFWNGVALYTQRRIIEEAEAVALAAVGTDIGEANESKVKDVIEEMVIPAEYKQIDFRADGSMTIPAVACSKPTNSTHKIVFMESNLGGMQLHYNRTGKPETFEYVVSAPTSGIYTLTALVVTPTPEQTLLLSLNGADTPTAIALPFTLGMWDVTAPVKVALKKGENVLKFSRGGDNIRGLTIKSFTLVPVEG